MNKFKFEIENNHNKLTRVLNILEPYIKKEKTYMTIRKNRDGITCMVKTDYDSKFLLEKIMDEVMSY